MAKLYGNAFEGFKGTVGNLVGYNWKGVWCVRSRPAAVRNPRSKAQQRHRAMFAEEVRLAGRMSWAVNLGFAAVADELHMTPQNVFVKANQGAFSFVGDRVADHTAGGHEQGNGGRETAEHTAGGGGNAERGGLLVDWETLAVSAGPVAPVALGAPAVSAEGVLSVDFEKNPQHTRADNFDQVHLYVYCPQLSDGYMAAPVYRKERRISVALPDAFIGQEMHVYAFATDSQGRASESCYGGVSEYSECSEYSEDSEYSEYSENSEYSEYSENSENFSGEEVLPDEDVGEQSMQLSLFSPL